MNIQTKIIQKQMDLLIKELKNNLELVLLHKKKIVKKTKNSKKKK